MPVYASDELTHPFRSMLCAESFGALWRLILRAWLNEGYLPDNQSTLQILAGVKSGKKWKRIWEDIQPFFDATETDGLTNSELYSLYQEQLNRAMTNKEKARNAANSRWGNRSIEQCL